MFETFDRGNGIVEVRTENGIAHLRYTTDGTAWTVVEDPRQRIFPNRGEAFDCVRVIMKVGD